MHRKELAADVLIIGGGAAGCYAALTLAEEAPGLKVVLAEKAGLDRSGCLAAGVNALNAYITPGHRPEDYVDYARHDAAGIVRGDLLLSLARGLNRVTAKLEELGLVILKNPDGSYAQRGWRNIKINGENIKPLLAAAVRKAENVQVLEHLNIAGLLKSEGRAAGAWGFAVNEPVFYAIHAPAVICATGGAAGLYRPNHPGFSRHKMWYCPFDTGAGYAMGLKAGAEMTTFEMRFIALRCKATIAPTGTLAQGVGAEQINARGEHYQHKYGNTTSERLYAVVSESLAGRGPCYLETRHITEAQEKALEHAYLNMSPAQTMRWRETGEGPRSAAVEIEGTEPYVVGGHTASGYWLDQKRMSTVPGLFAAGDVAGGCPQKYVTGACVEGELAAKAAADFARAHPLTTKATAEEGLQEAEAFLRQTGSTLFTADALEEAMQQVMDEYAGGISQHYRYTEAQLKEAKRHLLRLERLTALLSAKDNYELMKIYELKERLLVAQVLVEHLRARKETRWHAFAENADYPQTGPDGECYINSRLAPDGCIEIIRRPLIREEDAYEHRADAG